MMLVGSLAPAPATVLKQVLGAQIQVEVLGRVQGSKETFSLMTET